MFKKGDLVVCIDDAQFKDKDLYLHKIYVIKSFYWSDHNFIKVENLDYFYHVCRFEKLEEFRLKKLKKLMENVQKG